jgi:hypothetical protein
MRWGLLWIPTALLASGASQAAPPPEPLKDPVRVREVLSTSELVLEDGRRIRIENPSSVLDRLKGRPVEVISLTQEIDGFTKAEVIIARRIIICGIGLPASDAWVRDRLSDMESK